MKRFGVVLTRHLVMAVVVLCVACTSGDHAISRTIDGVTARFEINTPTIHSWERLKATAFYKNNSSNPVVFRFLPPLFDAQVWRGDVEEPPCSTPEVPYTEVVLKPGEELPIKDENPLCLKPGRYEVRFYYSLGLLPDKKLAKEYKQKYAVAYGAIAWEERGHPFTVTK